MNIRAINWNSSNAVGLNWPNLAVEKEASFDVAAAHLARASQARGLRVSMWANLASSDPMLDECSNPLNQSVFGWGGSEEYLWDDFWAALRSPIVRGCRVESEAFWVNQSGFHTAEHNPRLDCVRLHNFEELSKAKSAIVVPIHQPFGQIGLAVFTPLDGQKDDLRTEFEQHGPVLERLARKTCISYTRSLAAEDYEPRNVDLTPQQIRCLTWAAFGKTDTEISQILDCSHATVRYHLNNSREMLDSASRAQCVFRAAQLGYLGNAF